MAWVRSPPWAGRSLRSAHSSRGRLEADRGPGRIARPCLERPGVVLMGSALAPATSSWPTSSRMPPTARMARPTRRCCIVRRMPSNRATVLSMNSMMACPRPLCPASPACSIAPRSPPRSSPWARSACSGLPAICPPAAPEPRAILAQSPAERTRREDTLVRREDNSDGVGVVLDGVRVSSRRPQRSFDGGRGSTVARRLTPCCRRRRGWQAPA